MIDFSNYKFRCSALGKLMVNSRSKNDPLSATTKTYLKDIFIAEVYGRRRDISNKFIEKGLLCEEDSLELIQKHYGNKLIIKNKENYSNSFIKGTPDYKFPKLGDAKSSWDIWTFANADGTNPDYYWQMQGYMWLLRRKVADLAYCLNDSPEHLIVDEKRKQMYFLGLVGQEGTEAFIKMEDEVEKNMKFGDIPEEERIKIFTYKFNQDDIEKLKERVIFARQYLSALSL